MPVENTKGVPAIKISQLMNRRHIVLNGDNSVKCALDEMTRLKINGAPVVDNDNNLIGMVVKADIYRFLIEPGRYDSYPLNRVMSKNVITAQEDEDILEVAGRLRANDIIAVPVVRGTKVQGLINIEDILDYFIEQATGQPGS